ncbi:MAG: ilvC, partial [Candidatus Brocadiaceae bacterium]|nr:ilvC [Candidatus Brocadiaceae bacterium]
MLKIYYEKDADVSILKGKKIAVIGYGSQGHAQAQNLRESGMDVIVSTRTGTPNYQLAVKHGFKPVTVDEAARQGDFLQILMPDETQKSVYESQIKPHLKEGKTLCFSHGFNIHFGQVVPPNNVDVIMVAPKGPGHLVRSEFEKGGAVPCLMAIHQDATGTAKKKALAYAHGIDGTRAGVIETTFAEETETDLFG